jgi:hypothetical protein
MPINSGDWVRSYSKGIWQVVRQVPEHYEPRYSQNAPRVLAEGPQYLLKRLVNDKWKPAFAMECAEVSFVKPLNKADTVKLQRYLAHNADVAAHFESFVQPLDSVLNLSFSLPKKSDFRRFKAEFEAAFASNLPDGVTHDDIMKVIAQSSFAAGFAEIPCSATLQFICQDHEVKRRHMIYRQLHVHSF